MPTAGPNFPTAATGNTNTIGGGTVAWTNPQNIEANDGSTTTSLPGVAITDDLIGTGFGFAIPAGATIQGILFEYAAQANTTGIAQAFNIRLLKAGVAAGTDKGPGSTWSTTMTTFSAGSSADLWGTTWTPSDINNASFGAAIVEKSAGSGPGTLQVNFFRITVTYVVNGTVSATGVSLRSAVGSATASGAASRSVTGVRATSHVGTATALNTVLAHPSGVSATSHIGIATAKGTATAHPAGVHAASVIGRALTAADGKRATSSVGMHSQVGSATVHATFTELIIIAVINTQAMAAKSVVTQNSMSATGIQIDAG